MLYVYAIPSRDWSSILSSNTSIFLQRKIRMHYTEINSGACTQALPENEFRKISVFRAFWISELQVRDEDLYYLGHAGLWMGNVSHLIFDTHNNCMR